MDFSWSQEQINRREQILKFAQQEISEDIIKLDQQEQFNQEDWHKWANFGIQSLIIPQNYGGQEMDILSTIYALESLGYAYKDNGLIFAMNAHIWACELPIITFGTEKQKQQYLPLLAQGKLIGGHAVSEPEAGSDVYSMKTIAQKKGDKYILNGSKMFVTNAPVADLILVFANLDSERNKKGITGFLIEKNSPGFLMKNKLSKMGLRTAQMGEIILDNCQVSEDNILGKEGLGMAIFNHAMEWERGFILASAVGTMERILNRCIKYARQRQQFGQPIGKFQLIGNKIVQMKLRLETGRNLLYKMGWLKQMEKPALLEAAMTKLYLSQAWIDSCLDAISIHGGYGYLTEFELERELRDALGSQAYSGTSEIQSLIIAKYLGL
ncbi:acyl-CoA dehydrogenase family protein [Anabaena sp. UHCC 0451]|uniref:acyl-CoA dehydrogenase family protein n=1 Tax=Anabaena sp. UHCC 0451 TaxID=2055235 RepID=UPI002B1F4325|nr:acyl-CoA dehydrogenase family protein [Anabaena sp. UHCC 0451]MEA5577337.1 acyl-CoA dehydrogenase family protein [Anabaena sp. UHCC 0451]